MSLSGGKPSAREALATVLDSLHSTLAVAKIAKAAGISERIAANAVRGQPIGAVAHLRLCAAAGFDPLPEIAHPLVAPADFDFGFFALALRLSREIKRHSEAEAAAAMRLGPSTVARLERGEATTITVVLRGCRYLGVHPFGYFRSVIADVSRETMAAEGDVSLGLPNAMGTF